MSSLASISALIASFKTNEMMCDFENQLKKSVLTKEKLSIFFATLWAFYRETPNGILSLSLRLSDQWLSVDPWEATAQAAYLLTANCDEMGLCDPHQARQKTHHQLFLLSAQHFGIFQQDLVSRDYILSAGEVMGSLSSICYRQRAIAEGLGFHLASEYTSFLEFTAFFNGFMAHKAEYHLTTSKNPVVQFFKVHTIVEPLHQQQSEMVIENYLAQYPSAIGDVLSGIREYFAAYHQLFHELTQALFDVE